MRSLLQLLCRIRDVVINKVGIWLDVNHRYNCHWGDRFHHDPGGIVIVDVGLNRKKKMENAYEFQVVD